MIARFVSRFAAAAKAAPASGPATSPKATSGSMRAIGPSLLLFALTLAFADTTQDVVDLFGGMAAGLSEGDAAAFLRPIDPSAPNYAALARNVTALVNQNELSCSIEVLKQEADGAAQVV